MIKENKSMSSIQASCSYVRLKISCNSEYSTEIS
jgi:hypothetical protein